ncbi:MAG TPA: type II toxin-antitoxin system antitoxin SocA domain-containing protein [Nitriliruptorales bacterium]
MARALRDELSTDPGTVKLHKLLYYCQAWHATWTGEALFDEPIEAWENGPVVADLWRVEKHGFRVSMPDEPLSDEEARTVSYVVSRYGSKWASQLIGETHAERPWREAYARGRNTVIPIESMRAFFADDAGADQAGFWTKEWREGEVEAMHDARAGRTKVFYSTDEFLESL